MTSTIYMYSYIPSLIVSVFAVVNFLAWAFGTDLYDKFNKILPDNDDKSIVKWSFLIPGTVSTILWLLTIDDEIVKIICGIINIWLAFWLLLFLFIEIVDAFSAFRNYCLSKRGKK